MMISVTEVRCYLLSKQKTILKRIHKICINLGMEQHYNDYIISISTDDNIINHSIVLSLNKLKRINLPLNNEASQLLKVQTNYSKIKTQLDEIKSQLLKDKHNQKLIMKKDNLIKPKNALRKLIRKHQECFLSLDTNLNLLGFVKREQGIDKTIKWFRNVQLNNVIVVTLQFR